METTRAPWEKQLWHLGNQRFACAPDAHAALAHQLKQLPEWLTVQARLIPHLQQNRPGRPRQDMPPGRTAWQIQTPIAVAEAVVTHTVQRKVSSLVASTMVAAERLPDQELIRTYKDQHCVERGCSLLKDPDPLLLASLVFGKKPTRIVALSLVMVLCLLIYLVYRLVDHRLREQLAVTGQTVPNHLKEPTDRPMLRGMFQCFEGISLVRFLPPHAPIAHPSAPLLV